MSTAPPMPDLSPDRAGVTVWSVPAYAPYVMPMVLLSAITAWMEENEVFHTSTAHEVRVDAYDDGTRVIIYQREEPDGSVFAVRVPLDTEPPELPDFPDLGVLGAMIDEHPVGLAHPNTAFPIGSPVCLTCTEAAEDCHPAVYPCPPLLAAATAAGTQIYPDD